MLFVSFHPIISQTFKEKIVQPRFGVYLGGGYDVHSANFTALPGIPNCCPVFENGSGFGFQFQAVYEHPISDQFFLSSRVGYSSRSGSLVKDESTTLFVMQSPSSGIFRHELSLDYSQITLELLPQFNPFESITIQAGLSAGFLVNPIFNQQETILLPEFGSTFADSNGNNSNQRIRNQFSGSLPDATNFQVGLLAGIGYTVPLNGAKSLLARPEISFRLPITSFSSSVSWKASSFQVGITILYRNIPPVILEKPIEVDIPLVEKVVDTFQKDKSIVEKPDDTFTISGRTLKSDGSPLETAIIIEDLKTGEKISEAFSNSKTGQFSFSLDFGRYYSYSFQSDGYYPPSKRIDLRMKTDKNSQTDEDIVVKSIEEIVASGEEILINNIFFESDKANLQQESFLELNKLIEILTKFSTLFVTIEAHTDNLGSDKYNNDLSNRRAISVREYLESEGIQSTRITEIGYGKKNPIASNETEEGRSLNRRVQFRLELK